MLYSLHSTFIFFPLIAQLVEQLPLKEMVPGSSPGERTIKLKIQSSKCKNEKNTRTQKNN